MKYKLWWPMIKLLDWLDKYAFLVSACWFSLAVVIYGYHAYWYYLLVGATIICIAGLIALVIKGLIWAIDMLSKDYE